MEFDDAPEMEALESSLAIDSIEVRGGDFEPPTNVGQAGQSGIAVGAITPDRNQPRRRLVLVRRRQPAPGRRKRRRRRAATGMRVNVFRRSRS